MARLVLVALSLSLPAGAGWAQTANIPPISWDVSGQPRAPRSFDLASTRTDQLYREDPAGRVVAGTELLPNGTVGFGMFGEEKAKPGHSRATAQDYSLPQPRKPAVGLSLKF